MKKYLVAVLPILMLSCGVSAATTDQKEQIQEMRKDVKGMTKEDVTERHIELFDAVKKNPTEKNCNAFEVFNTASNNEKKIELLDFDAGDRVMNAVKACNGIKF